MLKAIARAPGSCGELVQGTINGKNFLVTCPIDIFSQVEVTRGKQQSQAVGTKTVLAVQKTMQYLDVFEEIKVTVKSLLPVGKGMASSSADISAACLATADFFGKGLTEDEIAEIALSIEPTDGIFFPGIVMFDHIHGQVRYNLGNPPELEIAVFDCGGEVDTLYFNKREELARLNKAKEPQVKAALELVIAGLRTGDVKLIGKAATISARAKQDILFKPDLETIINIAESNGAVGIIAAHSGTVLGVMLPTRHKEKKLCIQAIQAACPKIVYFYTRHLIAGGLCLVKGEKYAVV